MPFCSPAFPMACFLLPAFLPLPFPSPLIFSIIPVAMGLCLSLSNHVHVSPWFHQSTFCLAEPPSPQVDMALNLLCCRSHWTSKASVCLSPGVASRPFCRWWMSAAAPGLLWSHGKNVVLGDGSPRCWPQVWTYLNSSPR